MTYKLKNIAIAIMLVIGTLAPLATVNGAHAASEPVNLLSNFGAVQMDASGNPTNYNQDAWGSNTASFAVIPQGSDNALRVDVSDYIDGDAKWYHDSVNIGEGVYTYQDVYRSSTDTHYFAQYIGKSGLISYQWLGVASASTDWQAKTVSVPVAETVASVAVFHVLSDNGFIETRQSALYSPNQEASCSVAEYNNVINGNFESVCDDQATAGWSQDVYGLIDASYSYSTDAFEGNLSVTMTINSAPSGEAGWGSSPISIAADDKIDISFRYHSNVYLYAYAEIYDTNGQVSYTGLRSIVASEQGWGLYEDSFIAPVAAKNFILHIATSDVGTVAIDAVGVATAEQIGNSKFISPMISINFDDGFAGTYRNGEALMREFGFVGTYYLNYATLNTRGYMSTAQVKNMASLGNEIGSHGYNHVDMVSLTPQLLNDQIDKNATALQQMTGQQITNFATPFSAYDTNVVDAIMSRHASHRNTSGALNYKYNFSYSQIHSKVITKQTMIDDIQSLIDQAKRENAWLVLTFHDISTSNNSGDEYTIGRTTLKNYLQLIRNSQVNVKTNQAALIEIAAQLTTN